MLLAASASFVAAGFAIQACGGDTSADPPAVEAGVPEAGIADTGPKDTGADAKDAAPPCDPNADFTTKIPDASIADGASTTGLCAACAKTKCKTELAACNKDCPCQNLASGALDCFAKSQDLLKCGSGFFGANSTTQNIGLAMFDCIRDECNAECAADQFAPDAGDAGDGG